MAIWFARRRICQRLKRCFGWMVLMRFSKKTAYCRDAPVLPLKQENLLLLYKCVFWLFFKWLCHVGCCCCCCCCCCCLRGGCFIAEVDACRVCSALTERIEPSHLHDQSDTVYPLKIRRENQLSLVVYPTICRFFFQSQGCFFLVKVDSWW